MGNIPKKDKEARFPKGTNENHFRVKVPPTLGTKIRDPRLPEDTPYRKRIAGRKWTLPDEYEPGFLSTMDRRGQQYLSIKRNFEIICQEQGGPVELSHQQMILIERLVFLVELISYYEYKTIKFMKYMTDPSKGARRYRYKGKVPPEMVDKMMKVVQQLQSVCKLIGIKKRMAPGRLRTYLNEKNA